jgi:hypothetical protein
MSNRILDLDADAMIEVTLGGRSFTITQQRAAVLEQVLLAVYNDSQQADLKDDATMRELSQLSLARWQESIPTFALILGVEPGDANHRDTVAHLETHLTFPKAQQLFEAWYELNQVESFFYQAGNPLIPLARLREFRATANGDALTLSSADSNLTPTSP